MAKLMTKAKVAAALAGRVDIPKKASAAYLEALAALMNKEAKNGFALPGVGKLVPYRRRPPTKTGPKSRTAPTLSSYKSGLVARIARSPVPSLRQSAVELGLSAAQARRVDAIVENMTSNKRSATRKVDGKKTKRTR